MAINKPEQASTEMTKVLKSIADTIDGKSNTDCAATSEISKWTKYVGNKLAENSGSGGGSGVEIVEVTLNFDSTGNAIYFTDKDGVYISESNFLSILSDENKIVLVRWQEMVSVMINEYCSISLWYSDNTLLTMKKITYSSRNGWAEYDTKVAVSSSSTSTYTKTNLSYAAEQV